MPEGMQDLSCGLCLVRGNLFSSAQLYELVDRAGVEPAVSDNLHYIGPLLGKLSSIGSGPLRLVLSGK